MLPMRFMDLDSTEWQKCRDTDYTDLAEQLKAGGPAKESAMSCLFEKLFHQVHQMKKKFGKLTEEEILTAYSRAMINMMKAVVQDGFRGDSAFTTWFYSIFYRRCVDIVRKKSTKPNESNTATPANPETTSPELPSGNTYGSEEIALPEWKEIEDDDTNPENLLLLIERSEQRDQSFKLLFSAVETAMENMTENCRQLLQAYFEGYKMEEIAGMSELKNAHTARQSVFRCRTRLRKGILKELTPHIDELGEKCRQLLNTYLSGRSTKKIANDQGIPEEKVQRRISNCFNELKEKMAEN